MSIDWDPEFDTPATIAIIGGGPVGVEAGLYARFLGYDVWLFDSVKVGHRQLAWGDQPLQQPFGSVTSSLGLAALAAQGTAGECPAPEASVTYREYVEKYLLPVARTDLLYDSVQIQSPVLSISRTGCGNTTPIEQRAEQEFRVLIDSGQRGEYTQLVDIVIDCSGLSQRSGLASGGGIAIGERACQQAMRTGKVDMLGKHRAKFAGRHALLFGRELSACANALELSRLAEQVEGTRVTWIVPKQLGQPELPLLDANCDAGFVSGVQGLLNNEHSAVVRLSAWGIEALQFDEAAGWMARLQVGDEETLEVRGDTFVNCHDATCDWSFAAGLVGVPSTVHAGVTAEPHFYVLGQKAVGPDEPCTFEQGFEQIKRLFAIIGGRADLDLYETVRRHNATQG